MDKSTRKIFDRLEQVIETRKGADPKSSYVAKLFGKGREHIAKKVGEEAVETALAANVGGKQELVSESADLMFHLLVLLADAGLSLDDVAKELAQREGISGIDEKASRKK